VTAWPGDGPEAFGLGTAPRRQPPAPAVAIHRRPAVAESARLGRSAAARPGGRRFTPRSRRGTDPACHGSGKGLPGAPAGSGGGGRCPAGGGGGSRGASARRTVARGNSPPRRGDQFRPLACGCSTRQSGGRRTGVPVAGVCHREPCRSGRAGSAALGGGGPGGETMGRRRYRRARWNGRSDDPTAPGGAVASDRGDRSVELELKPGPSPGWCSSVPVGTSSPSGARRSSSRDAHGQGLLLATVLTW